MCVWEGKLCLTATAASLRLFHTIYSALLSSLLALSLLSSLKMIRTSNIITHPSVLHVSSSSYFGPIQLVLSVVCAASLLPLSGLRNPKPDPPVSPAPAWVGLQVGLQPLHCSDVPA